MKKYILICSLFVVIGTNAQKKSVDQLVDQLESVQNIYIPLTKSGKHLYLKMGYGSSEISNPEEINQLKGVKIACIDIVYSDFPKNKKLENLLKVRIENLLILKADLLNFKEIRWNLIRQTNCSTIETAKKLFHGIVITYRPFQSKKETRAEITFLDSILRPISKSKRGWTITTTFTIDPKTGLKKVLHVSDTVFSKEKKSHFIFTPTLTNLGNNPVVTKVLERNKWVKMLITADLTGSMSPYTAQLLTWFQLNNTAGKVNRFVFFNDGDMKLNHEKIIGNTGGIYETTSSKFEDVKALAYKTMMNGCGGDSPENNIEALLKGIKLSPDCKNIVMIADNWAPIKDFSLASRIKTPIKIILCGTDFGINVQYLNLARITGGSIHTIENDITELMKVGEGEIIIIEGQSFKIIHNSFVKIIST